MTVKVLGKRSHRNALCSLAAKRMSKILELMSEVSNKTKKKKKKMLSLNVEQAVKEGIF